MSEPSPSRIVHCQDALAWLGAQSVLEGCSLVSSMPDISEFPNYSLSEWKQWFSQTASLILSKCPDNGVTIFYQSDIKHEGAWVDKGYLCQKTAESLGHELLWHKIACRAPAGTPTFARPSYSHLLCFSKGLRLVDMKLASADVMADIGEKTWQRGMGLKACLTVAKFIAQQTSSHTVVNPFCGEGSMLAAANTLNLNAIGIERSPKRAEKARLQRVSPDEQSWELA